MSLLHYFPENETSPIEITLNPDETVLEGLLRAGFDIPNGCRAGICQSCVLKSEPEAVPAQAKSGLKPAQTEAGMFLSCCCVPDAPMRVAHTNNHAEAISAVVKDKVWLNNDILGLQLLPEKPFDYRPGQFITLSNQQTSRCYSLASTPNNDFLELHIKHLDNGELSNWIAENLHSGIEVELRGPFGECFYTPCEQPLLLAGIGTGLAPLYGILLDALEYGHTQNIHLVLGGKSENHFYMIDRLLEMTEVYDNLSVTFVSQTQPADITGDNFQQGDVYQWIGGNLKDLKNYRVYLCGSENFVRKMKKICFLSGAAMQDIQADAFVPFNNK